MSPGFTKQRNDELHLSIINGLRKMDPFHRLISCLYVMGYSTCGMVPVHAFSMQNKLPILRGIAAVLLSHVLTNTQNRVRCGNGMNIIQINQLFIVHGIELSIDTTGCDCCC